MCWAKTFKEDIEKMRSKMHENVDALCDTLKSEDKDQVYKGLEELESNIDEAALDAILPHDENNNQESTPLLPEQQQELRNRIRSKVLPELEGSRHESPGVQKPGESFCEWVLRLFQEMLSRLQKKWQDLLAWVQEKWLSFVERVKTIWSKIKDFCSRVAQYFLSLFQV